MYMEYMYVYCQELCQQNYHLTPLLFCIHVLKCVVVTFILFYFNFFSFCIIFEKVWIVLKTQFGRLNLRSGPIR